MKTKKSLESVERDLSASFGYVKKDMLMLNDAFADLKDKIEELKSEVEDLKKVAGDKAEKKKIVKKKVSKK